MIKRRNGSHKALMLTVSIVLLVLVGVGVTVTYIMKKTEPIVNNFLSAKVACAIEENFDGTVKSDVSIKNTGNVSAYIRAKVLVTWQVGADAVEIYSRSPKENENYSVIWGDSSWVLGDDGYWYYTQPVAVGENTSDLIESIIPIGEAPEGYTLSVEILASAIQADPISVVETEWQVMTFGTEIIP